MRNNIDIEGRIIEKDEPREIKLKSGADARVCGFMLQDESGEIPLSLWNDDIEKVSRGDIVKITNGYTNTYKGEVFLQVGKHGKIEVNV